MFNRYGKFIENADIPASKRVKYVDNADTTLSTYENVVVVSSDTSAVVITLPDVGEAAGQAFDVTAPDGITNKVQVKDANGNQLGNDLAANNDYITIVSTGMEWRVLANSAA